MVLLHGGLYTGLDSLGVISNVGADLSIQIIVESVFKEGWNLFWGQNRGKWCRWIEWSWFQNLKKLGSWDMSFKKLRFLKKSQFLACNFWSIDFFKIIQKTIKNTPPWLQNDIKKSWGRRSQFYAKRLPLSALYRWPT